MKDYYRILKIRKTATSTDIRVAWKKLAKKYHPDIHSDESSKTKMQDINEAYEVLKNKAKRKKYDISMTPQINTSVHNTLIKDLISRSSNINKKTDKAPDIIIHTTQKGVQTIKTPVRKRCDICDGTGLTNAKICSKCKGRGKTFPFDAQCAYCKGFGLIGNTCTKCNGTGTTYDTKTIHVDIKHNKTILEGQGDFIKGGTEGDIVIVSDEKQLTILAQIYDMYFGNTIDVDTPKGKVRVVLPKKTQSGTKLRLKGENIVLNIMAYVPQNLCTLGYDTMSEIMNKHLFDD